MYSLSWILVFLAITTFTFTHAQNQYQPYQAEDEEVFSILDNKDVIMHAYTKSGQKHTFTTRFEENGVFKPSVSQELPSATDIEYVHMVHALDKARCRFQFGDVKNRNQVSNLFGPYQRPYRLSLRQAHTIECVAPVGFTGDNIRSDDPVPESSQRTTFLKARKI